MSAQDQWESWDTLVRNTIWQPGSTLSVVELLPGAFELRVALITQDSHAPDKQVKIGHRSALPSHIYQAGESVMKAHLRQCLRQVAIHESDEWIIISGERLFDPHRGRS